MYIETMIVASYLTSKPTVRNSQAPDDSYLLIQPWYESLIKLGLRGVIVHDNLSPRFVERYTTDLIGFHKIDPDFPWPPEEQKLLNCLEVMKKSQDEIFFNTDLWDVVIKHNPYPIMSQDRLSTGAYGLPYSSLGKPYDRGPSRNDPRLRDFLQRRKDDTVASSWLVGGHRSLLEPFLEKYKSLRNDMGEPKIAADMVLLGYVLELFGWQSDQSLSIISHAQALGESPYPFTHGAQVNPKHTKSLFDPHIS